MFKKKLSHGKKNSNYETLRQKRHCTTYPLKAFRYLLKLSNKTLPSFDLNILAVFSVIIL